MRHAIPKSTPLTTPQVLLVPTTEVLLNSKDRETNTRYADLAGSEEFLASHVLRVPGASGASDGGKNAGNVRESKGKAKQYSTVNGRTVVVKDAFVYSNKGFKTLNQAQLLSDVIFFPDTADGQQWLVYYISKPLIGSFEALPIIPASIASTEEQERRAKQRHGNVSEAGSSSPSQSPKKKEIKDFSDLLGQFPMIARQMQPGLEKIFKEFSQQFDKPITKRHSRTPSVSSERSSSSLADSLASLRSSLADSDTLHPSSLALDPDEDAMRFALESAITTAIDLFQGVDRQQLSLLGATTDLSGPLVERLIERYVAEQLHDMVLFPRICSIRRPEDMSLESNIRKMTDIDIAQVGIPIECGMQGKRELALRLENGIAAFKKMGVASSPQEMVDILLATQKAVTVAQSLKGTPQETENSVEKQSLAMTVNADVLVSMLLIVVIRSGVRHMHARLSYMRHFIFIDDVESGETGYALSTFEAVLAYLSSDSSALRRASRRNSKLWEATRNGDLTELRSILEPGRAWLENADVTEEPEPSEDMSDEASDVSHSDLERGPEEPFSDLGELPPDRMSMRGGDFAAVGGSLAHVFPFQKPPTPPPESAPPRVKRVTMAALRSASLSSGYSSRSHSRTKSMDSGTSAMSDGDTSIDKLAQTQGHGGDSLLMMAVEAGQLQCLQYLLSLQGHFPIEMVLDDCNSSGTTLLSAAIQGDDKNLTNYLLHHIIKNTPSEERLRQYFSRQDNKGRCFAHYLFNQPHLMDSIGEKIPWTLKDKNGQTPLFALCRSYDHEEYRWMVEKALSLASMTQGDHEPLHLDDHVDVKGNTLLHIVADQPVMMKLLQNCDSDVNAANDKRFTPIMVASKYGRFDLVRALFSDPRVEMQARDIRGLTAVELAKDDEVRNRIDDLVLLSTPPAADGRITTVVRSFFVDDATIRLVLKSGGPNANARLLASYELQPPFTIPHPFQTVTRTAPRHPAPARRLPPQPPLPHHLLHPRNGLGVLPRAGHRPEHARRAQQAQSRDPGRESPRRLPARHNARDARNRALHQPREGPNARPLNRDPHPRPPHKHPANGLLRPRLRRHPRLNRPLHPPLPSPTLHQRLRQIRHRPRPDRLAPAQRPLLRPRQHQQLHRRHPNRPNASLSPHRLDGSIAARHRPPRRLAVAPEPVDAEHRPLRRRAASHGGRRGKQGGQGEGGVGDAGRRVKAGEGGVEEFGEGDGGEGEGEVGGDEEGS
ncbi:hypothetical protein M8818_006893 [Zalaria obscura]|uniref:Uncharacterized protein n=1 Tax=Zalaria obscura TaxID=2024903 RepID=A0ACC3S567_9PEZI